MHTFLDFPKLSLGVYKSGFFYSCISEGSFNFL